MKSLNFIKRFYDWIDKSSERQYVFIMFGLPTLGMIAGTTLGHPDLDHLISVSLASLIFDGLGIGVIFMVRYTERKSLKTKKCGQCGKYYEYGTIYNKFLCGDGWRCDKCLAWELRI